MTKVSLKEVEKMAEKFKHDLDLVQKELRNVSSQKTRLKKQKFKSSYNSEMTELLKYNQVLVEVRSYLKPEKKSSTELTENDIKLLDYTETMNSLNSIRSKKSNTKYTTLEPGTSTEYINACKIEEMLLAHKQTVQPVEPDHVRKTDIELIIDTIENTHDISTEKILELLQELL